MKSYILAILAALTSAVSAQRSVTATGSGTSGTLLWPSNTLSLGSSQVLRLIGGTGPTTDAAGEFSFDTNAWDTGRGAFQLYDGTANTYILAALASDTPSNGQVPTWNTGGTITWEAAGAGAVATDTIWDAAGDLVYGTGANTGARLAIGTANKLLQVNAGATAPEWTDTVSIATMTATTGNIGSLVFEGATADDFETTLTVTDPTADRTVTLPNADTTVPVMTQLLTFAGPTAARTITLPDAAFTVARTDAANTFTGVQTMTSPVVNTSLELGHATANTLTASGGVLSVEGVAVLTTSSTDTLTNKTLDASGTGNVVKMFGYLVLTHPHVFGSGVTQQTTVTANTYGQALFSNSVDKATNYVEYYCVIPPDVDTAIDLTATFKFKLGGADTNDHEYEISFDSVAASAPYAGTLADAISLAYTADASGADADVEQAGETTLTGWRSAMTAGQLFVIRVARDGDHASDTSTQNSYSGPLVIKYGITQ